MSGIRSVPRWARGVVATAIACAVFMGFAAPSQACTNYYVGAYLLPYPAKAVWMDEGITSPTYAERRGKWNSGNSHDTAMSYNLAANRDIYEVTHISANSHSAHHFTHAHPGYFSGNNDHVVFQASNKGGSSINPYGQLCV